MTTPHPAEKGSSPIDYRTVLDSICDAVIIHDGDGRILDVNSRMLALFRTTREEALSFSAIDYTGRHAPDEVQQHWLRALNGERLQVSRKVRRPADGSEFDAEIHISRAEFGGASVLVASVRDVSAGVKALEALSESERRFRETLETVNLLAIRLSSDGSITFCNDFLLRLTGWSREEILGRNWFDLFIPETHPLTRLIFTAGMECGSIPVHYENDIITKSGERRFISWNNTVLRGLDGETVGASSIGQDITEKKRADEELWESEQRYASLFEHNNTVMMLVDPHTVTLVDANPAACRFYGYSREEMQGMPVGRINPLPESELRERMREASAQGGMRFDFRHRLASGEIRHVELYSAPLRLQGKKILYSIVHDVTPRKKAERLLMESEDRFRQVLEQSDDGIVLSRFDSREVIYCNSSLEQLLGYTPDELFRAGMLLLFSHFQAERMEEIYDSIAECRDHLLTFIPTKRKDGSAIVLSLRVRFIRIYDNDLVYCSFRDISEKARMEEEAHVTQGKLIHASKMSTLGIMVSGIAHEINNPNNFIMFNSSLLSDIWDEGSRMLEKLQAERGEFSLGGLPFEEVKTAAPRLIEGIAEGSRRIKTIVENLRDFSRPEPAPEGNIDVNQAVLKALSILTPQVKRHNAVLRLNLADELPPACGSFQQIEQVIINLILNALQALPDRDRGIHVATSLADAATVVVTIRDEGRGMEAEVLERLTEPFFTTRQETGGTGLGLFISQSIVRDHGGRLSFRSQPGEGTEAILELPICTNGRDR